MYKKGEKYYADWRDAEGVRHRKAHRTAGEAHAYEDRKKADKSPKGHGTATLRQALVPMRESRTNSFRVAAAKWLADRYGAMKPSKLGQAEVASLNVWIESTEAQGSRAQRAGAARGILDYLAEAHGTSRRLRDAVNKQRKPTPRNVTATAEEIKQLRKHATEQMLLWLLLCSDMALRSGTAAAIKWDNWDAAARTLTFVTKFGVRQRLPVTDEIAQLVAKCGPGSTPLVWQLTGKRKVRTSKNGKKTTEKSRAAMLNKDFQELKKQVGITRDLRPHDLRRSTARAMYDHTRDLRIVQALLGHHDMASTLWYLRDQNTEITGATLNAIKAKREIVQ